MTPPTFAQPERRSFSFALPLLGALAILIAGLALLHRNTKSSIAVALLHTEILPNTTVYKSDSIVIGPPETTYTLFVVSTVQVSNGRPLPLSLDDLALTLTDPTGAQLTAQALRPQELANAETSFPKLKALVASPILVRDTPIASDQKALGTAVFSFAVPQSVWDRRKSAVLAVTPYRLDPLTLTIPLK